MILKLHHFPDRKKPNRARLNKINLQAIYKLFKNHIIMLSSITILKLKKFHSRSLRIKAVRIRGCSSRKKTNMRVVRPKTLKIWLIGFVKIPQNRPNLSSSSAINLQILRNFAKVRKWSGKFFILQKSSLKDTEKYLSAKRVWNKIKLMIIKALKGSQKVRLNMKMPLRLFFMERLVKFVDQPILRSCGAKVLKCIANMSIFRN